ncbi:MAG: ABC transporter permease [Clostridium sp.]
MGKLVLAEYIKFKKSSIRFLGLILLVPIVLVTFIYWVNPKYVFSWNEFIVTITTFENFLVMPFVFGFLGIYIFGSEYESGTIDILFSYPISRSRLFLGKLIFIFICIIIGVLGVLIISILLGLAFKGDELRSGFLVYILIAYLKMVVMHFALVPFMVLLVIISKGIVIPTISLMGVCFFNLVVVNTSINILYPWSIPVIFSPTDIGREYTNYVLGTIIITIWFLVTFYYTYKKFISNK